MSGKPKQEKKESFCWIVQMLLELSKPNTFYPDPRLNRYKPKKPTPHSRPLILERVPQKFPDLKPAQVGESSRARLLTTTNDSASNKKPLLVGELHQQITSGEKHQKEAQQERKKIENIVNASYQLDLF